MQLTMELTGFYCNSWPILTVKQDNTTVFEQPIIDYPYTRSTDRKQTIYHWHEKQMFWGE